MAKYTTVETTVLQAGLLEVVVEEHRQKPEELPSHSEVVEEEGEVVVVEELLH